MAIITIFRDGVEVGRGYITLHDTTIKGCEAVLGPGRVESEETYETIVDEIEKWPRGRRNGGQWDDEGWYTQSGSVVRSYGVYSWKMAPQYAIETGDDDDGWDPSGAGNTDNLFDSEEEAEESRQELIACCEDFTEENTRVEAYQ